MKSKKRTKVRRTATKPRSVRITITTNEKVESRLKALIPLGLYGNNVAEVGERLICWALLTDMKKTKINLLNEK